MGKKWARLAREQVGYGLVGRDARATVPSSTGETVTRGPIQGVRIEEKPDRFKLPDFKTFEQPTYVKVEVQINGEWFLVSKVEVKRGEAADLEADNEALREAPDACFYFASVNGPTSGIVARRLTDLFGRDAVAREFACQQSKGQHPSNGGK